MIKGNFADTGQTRRNPSRQPADPDDTGQQRRAGNSSASGRLADLQRRDAGFEYVIPERRETKPSDRDGYDEMAQILWQASARDPARSCH